MHDTRKGIDQPQRNGKSQPNRENEKSKRKKAKVAMTDQQLRRHLKRITPGLKEREVEILVADQDFAPFLKRARHGEVIPYVTLGVRIRAVRFTDYNKTQKIYRLE